MEDFSPRVVGVLGSIGGELSKFELCSLVEELSWYGWCVALGGSLSWSLRWRICWLWWFSRRPLAELFKIKYNTGLHQENKRGERGEERTQDGGGVHVTSRAKAREPGCWRGGEGGHRGSGLWRVFVC